MKKYIFTILFFLGCFFISFSTDSDLVNAQVGYTITTDAYDSKTITIDLNSLTTRVNRILVNEVEYCELGEDECKSYMIDTQENHLRVLATQEYSVSSSITASLEYRINSDTDGLKYLFVQSFDNTQYLSAYSCLFSHKLSTLIQRVVINSDGNGKPMHVYNQVQYSPVRILNIDVNLLEEEEETYSGVVYVCEVVDSNDTRCSEYLISDGTILYYMISTGDGLKSLNIYLVKSGNTILDSGGNLSNDLKNKSQLVSKNIYLDTIGPEIVLEGGLWTYVEAGQTYTAQKATCKDAIFDEDECSVSNDLDVVKIDYRNGDYQLVTYEASDRLGNIKTVTAKIKVEIKTKDSSNSVYFIVAGCILVTTAVVLGYILIKNREKKKKMSYI